MFNCSQRSSVVKSLVSRYLDLRIASIDSGKPMVDTAFGELLVTFEKIWWLITYGERYLRRDERESGIMVGLHNMHSSLLPNIYFMLACVFGAAT